MRLLTCPAVASDQKWMPGSEQSEFLVGRQAGRRKSAGLGEQAWHTRGLGRQKERSVQVTEVHSLEPFCSGFWVEGYEVSRSVGPGPIRRVTASAHECWTFPFSGRQRLHFLGEGTLGQSSLGTDSPVLPGWAPGGRTLDSGQSVVERDSRAKVTEF